MFPIEVFIAPDILLIANYFLNIFKISSNDNITCLKVWEFKYSRDKNKMKTWIVIYLSASLCLLRV